MGTVEIAGGEEFCAELIAAEAFDYPLAEYEKVSLQLPQPGFVYAPVARNQQAGYAYICIDGKVVGKVPLVYGRTVEQTKEKKLSFWDKLFREEG